MAMINRQQQITDAFSPRSLAGFDTGGCGCGSLDGCGGASLQGLDGWWDDLTGWFGTPQAPGIDCNDSGNWRVRDYGNGVCANECGNNSDRVDCPSDTPAPAPSRDLCLDEKNWTYVRYNDGTCATVCGARTAVIPCEYTSYGGAKTPPPASIVTKLRTDLTAKLPGAPVTTVSGNICDDTGLWLVKKGVNGKCYNYCSADIANTQIEIDAKFCVVGQDMTGKKDTGLASLNWMLIGGIGLAMLFAMRD